MAKTVTNQPPPSNLILLGDPAAGKATHARMLLQSRPMLDLDMGKELRRMQKQRARKALTRTLDQGKLTPTQIVRKILHEKIVNAPKHQGILFDGTPKMVGEAKLVHKWLKQQKRQDPVVVYLYIPMHETVKRMRHREEYFKGKFSKRADDNVRALKNRVAYYRHNIREVVKFFKTQYQYKKISSVGSKKQVHDRLMKYLKSVDF